MQFDSSVIRGLAYYTGTVFEAVDRKGELRAICGGGRYDGLMESMGGDRVPAVGFGFGDAVIVELLRARRLLPDARALQLRDGAQVLVYALSEALQAEAMRAAALLRAAGVRVDVVLEAGLKPRRAFQRGEKLGVAAVVMLADEEYSAGAQVVVKDLAARQQHCVPIHDVCRSVSEILQTQTTGQSE